MDAWARHCEGAAGENVLAAQRRSAEFGGLFWRPLRKRSSEYKYKSVSLRRQTSARNFRSNL